MGRGPLPEIPQSGRFRAYALKAALQPLALADVTHDLRIALRDAHHELGIRVLPIAIGKGGTPNLGQPAFERRSSNYQAYSSGAVL